MKKKKVLTLSQKITLAIFGLLVASAILIWLAVLGRFSTDARFVFCDVGEGDAIFLESPTHQQILVDGGPDNSVLSCLSKNMPFYDRSLDLVVLTHPDRDHLLGLVEVLRRYSVAQVLITGVKDSTSEYAEFLKIVQDKKIPQEIAQAGKNWQFGDLNLTVLWPKTAVAGQSFDNLNNTSIVLRADYLSHSALLTGDLEESAQEIWPADSKTQLRAEILKISHHGSRNGLSTQFLKSISPSIVIISVGADNHFGHPAPETLAKLVNKTIYRTDQDGEIDIVIDKAGKLKVNHD